MCYSHRDRKLEEKARKTARDDQERKRREQRAREEDKERAAKERELVKA